MRSFNSGCIERSGEIAAHVSTVEAARDMDVLRAALGRGRSSTYFGASYGTQLGATYAELFPDRVGRMVLDGAVDVTLDARESSLGQARGFETALRAYVQNCVDGGDCFLGDSVDAGLQRIADLLDEIDKKPLPTRDGRTLEPGTAFLGIVDAALQPRVLGAARPGPRRAPSTATARCCGCSPTSTPRADPTATSTTPPRRSSRSTASTTPRRSR